MVRLEKQLYEKILNTKTLGRSRNIHTPKKWINLNPTDYNAVQAGYLHEKSLVAKLAQIVLYPFYKKFWWEWQRDHALQRGYAMDDFYVYTEKDLRRSPFYEHIWRESCHPYQWLMYKYRRLRYYKVERVIQGFYVPDHLRDEVKKRTFAETMAVSDEWENFFYNNYMSDMTPAGHDFKGKWNPLELFMQYGLFRNEAWERMFYNEEEYEYIEPEDFQKYVVKPGGYDVESVEGRMAFENEINTLIQDFPGMITPEGQSFDFENFYMKWSLIHGKDTSRFEQSKLSSVYDSVKEVCARNADPRLILKIGGEEAKVGHSTVGTDFPARMVEENRQAIQN